MPQKSLSYEAKLDGYRVWRGDSLIGNIGTKQFQGLVRNGTYIYEAMPRETWTVHLTSPTPSLSMLKEILDSVPTDAGVTDTVRT